MSQRHAVRERERTRLPRSSTTGARTGRSSAACVSRRRGRARASKRRHGSRGSRLARGAASIRAAPTPDLALATRDLALALVQQAMRSHGRRHGAEGDASSRARTSAPVLPLAGGGTRLRRRPRRESAISRSRTPTPRASTSQIVRRGATVLVSRSRRIEERLDDRRVSRSRRDATLPWRASAMVRVGRDRARARRARRARRSAISRARPTRR